MRYPGIADYNGAMQSPAKALTDKELAKGTLAVNKLGLPIVLGGGFALTYTVSARKKKFAVRCFHRYVPDLEQHYAQISDAIGGLKSDHFVAFEYQREGVRVGGSLYPVVKMEWAEGPTLGLWLEDNYEDADAVRALAASFRGLATFLAARGIAHGDLENGNLVVRDRALTLIDYDGMYVPGMSLGHGNELGHTHFQHPGRTPDNFGPRIDDFSFILIDLSLAAVAHDPALYERFCNGDNILFQKTDFENPAASPVFRELRRIPALQARIDAFKTICARPIEQVPTFDEFLAAQEAPSRPAAAQAAAGAGATTNLERVRAALANSAPPSAPRPGQPASSGAGSRIPQYAPAADPGAALQRRLGGRWSLRIEAAMVGLLLFVILFNL